jgi:predicted ATPase
VLDLLAQLVNKSLVVLEEGRESQEEARYYLLETIRQYGQENSWKRVILKKASLCLNKAVR